LIAGMSDGGREIRLDHLLLRTTDLGRAEDFYVGFLGLSVKKRTLRDGRPLVVTDRGLGLTEAGPSGAGPLDHIAFRTTGVRAIADAAMRMGIPIVRGPVAGDYGLSLYLEDPDGNTIEVFEPEGRGA
jgi:ureidoacrylate peracid hydrolase